MSTSAPYVLALLEVSVCSVIVLQENSAGNGAISSGFGLIFRISPYEALSPDSVIIPMVTCPEISSFAVADEL
ncbi:hypothetical protein LZ31DRAFT_553969 [Colletotrichum somersetense]|nr:hypothetical protein LZ31DRAFT_553969 [Colletotrichum somersetense]